MDQPIFVVSLDFELHWGGFEKWPLLQYQRYFLNTRLVIPEMLRLFEEYEVHATWATVGILFHATKESLDKSLPILKPTYDDLELSAYHFMETQGVGSDEDQDPFHYGATLVKMIADSRYQELASHTFAHYYCNEPGQTIEQFKSDLQATQQSARMYGKNLQSLVFPRNQFNIEYLKVCYDLGFTAVRDNPRDWFWNIQSTKSESYWKRLNRGLDAYLPVGKENTFTLKSLLHIPGQPVCIPASRLLRPYNPKEFVLNDMKIRRIKMEMERAARNSEVYHLWWHPHNFGSFPRESMECLQQILDHYMLCNQRYNMISLSMAEVGSLAMTSK